jgi:hypothetical protein
LRADNFNQKPDGLGGTIVVIVVHECLDHGTPFRVFFWQKASPQKREQYNPPTVE